MARKYKIEFSNETGYWGWYCKQDGTLMTGGYTETRKEARGMLRKQHVRIMF